MDSSRSSLPNVDRANSTLFKRYLDEQHKSVVKTNHYPQQSRPINSTIQITHTHRQQQQQQQDTYTSKYNTSSNHQPVLVKRKCSNGRKPSVDTSKQRTSHTSRFMKRFQRQHKTGETTANVQKRDARPRFEFHNPSTTKQTRPDEETQCTCLVSSDRHRGGDHLHHHHCPAKPAQVPRLSLNELFHSTTQHRRQPVQGAIAPPPLPSSSPKPSRSPLPMLPPTINQSIRDESISTSAYPNEHNPPRSPSIEPSSILNHESETFILDPPVTSLPNDYYPIINDILQEISIEMNDKPSVDILLEIEESLAQRIYDCIIEHNGDDDVNNENDTISHSTTTNNSSALSAPPPGLPPANNLNAVQSNDLPPSPINVIAKDSTDNRDKYFQPIREPPSASFDHHLDRNRHSTPFNRLTKPIETDIRSPFTQSLFEPVNLLRTVNDDNDDFHFFPPSFTFDNHPSNSHLQFFPQSKSELSTTSQHHSFLNHLLPPRTTPIDQNLSAFKPIESSSIRSTAPFVLQRPQVINHPTGVNWFGQS